MGGQKIFSSILVVIKREAGIYIIEARVLIPVYKTYVSHKSMGFKPWKSLQETK